MTRVIVHAGFHKTGTSSLQLYLQHNRHSLRPWCEFFGMGDALHHSAVAARVYAKRPFVWRRRALRAALRADFSALPDADTIVLSREHYSGVMPGHHHWHGRLIRDFTTAAIPIGRAITSELRHRFGPDTRVEFLYTTRDGDDWLASVHGHLLNSLHLTDDFQTFRARFATEIDLAAQARRIAAEARADAVHIHAVEAFAHTPAGPAAAVLDLVGVPDDIRAALPAAPRENRGFSTELKAAFLALNRSGKPADELRHIKHQMIASAGNAARHA